MSMMGSAEVSTAMEKAPCSPDEQVGTGSKESRSGAREGCRSWVRTPGCVTRSCSGAKHPPQVCAGGRWPWMRTQIRSCGTTASLERAWAGWQAPPWARASSVLSLQGWRTPAWATGMGKGHQAGVSPAKGGDIWVLCPVWNAW